MFITFEGGEGSGKTTLINKIKDILSKKHQVLITREPGGGAISEAIREVILNNAHTNMTYQTEALLYAAARMQHLDEVIIPALKANQIVLCDRYLDSSIAYQGYARGLGKEYILKINDYATKYMPNYTFYIDLDPSVGMDRIKDREKLNRLDQEQMTFHEKVRKGYLQIAMDYPKRVILINGKQSVDAIITDVLSHLNQLL